MLSAICLNLDQSKILSSGNGLHQFMCYHILPLKIYSILEHMAKVDLSTYKPLPSNKILDWSKLEAFADAKLNVTLIRELVIW